MTIFNVLSLFDGISCGQLALNRLNTNFNYYASEISESAISVTQHHFPNTTQLGDIKNINLGSLPKIDLLIGGSPCQGFSLAGNRLNLDDDRSKLLFNYVEIKNKLNPKYFLLENVPINKKILPYINDIVGCEPHIIDSKFFSKQMRKRLYWTNIPIGQYKDLGLRFNNYLYRLGHGYVEDEIKFFPHYPTLVKQQPGTKYRVIIDIEKAKRMSFKELRRSNTYVISPEFCEELQALPIGYTNILNKTKRYKHIGNGWTVSVIEHILKGIKYD
jgi:DNA (cytosine-5)-methyltransferase 3A